MNARTRRMFVAIGAALVLVGALSACRNETQNQIRRSIQDFTNVAHFDGVNLFPQLERQACHLSIYIGCWHFHLPGQHVTGDGAIWMTPFRGIDQ